MTEIRFLVVAVDKPDDVNVILGQAHFIKMVDDLYGALAGSSPHLKFGVAFCEASGARRTGGSERDEHRRGPRVPCVPT